ncbi:hypothetical protein TcCL_Unassigned00809 [Trypanosoma cruzi]|nr:hypothetical protein TcCL_Unassigned00809 [Trypanosoma cruzi]
MAALQPPSTVHVQGIGECVCCQQSARRSPFTWVGDAQQTATSYAHGIHREKKKKHGGSTQIRGTRAHIDCTVRLTLRIPDGVHAVAARCLWPVAAVDRGNDEREEGCDAVLIHLG